VSQQAILKKLKMEIEDERLAESQIVEI